MNEDIALPIFCIGITCTIVGGFWLQLVALREFGLLRSWIIPFEEIFVCITRWNQAKFPAKICLLGIVFTAIGAIAYL